MTTAEAMRGAKELARDRARDIGAEVCVFVVTGPDGEPSITVGLDPRDRPWVEGDAEIEILRFTP